MASLPPQQTAGQRPQSRPHDSDETIDTRDSYATADYYRDSPTQRQQSDTHWFNSSQSTTSSPLPPPDSTTFGDASNGQQYTAEQSQTVKPVAADDEPRKCWICYSDETEDPPHSSQWRSPCPCALTAHEACLLDWLAELENPRTRRQNKGDVPLQCPQCKSKIVISRPRSYVVDFVRSCERLAGKLVIPGLVFTFAGTVWAGCCAHGAYSMHLVFGTEEVNRMLKYGGENGWNPVRNVGIPFIPIVLICSRMSWADGVLPALPVLFFATHNPMGFETQGTLWPPSATLTFAALPYVKSVYSALYERAFGKMKRKWIAEVQPRHGEEDEAGQQDGQQRRNNRDAVGLGGNGGILMEIDLELQIGMNDHPQNQDEINNIAEAGEAGAQNNGQGLDQQLPGLRRQELIHDTSSLADTILGALLLPAISAGMGTFLKLTLPRSWTAPPFAWEKGRAGLLQSRWGRSVIGGCLFVLFKDALMLYCRWRLAQTHRKRRIMDYDRAKRKLGK